MKKLIPLVFLFLGFVSSINGQSNEFQIISYSEFFELIEQEEDSVFKLNNTIVRYYPETDSLHFHTYDPAKLDEMRKDTIQVDKALSFDNVHFENRLDQSSRALHHIHFMHDVTLINTGSVKFYECYFEGSVLIYSKAPTKKGIDWIEANNGYSQIRCRNSVFRAGLEIRINELNIILSVVNCTIHSSDDPFKSFSLLANGLSSAHLENNLFLGCEEITIINIGTENFVLVGNEADRGDVTIHLLQNSINSNIIVLNNRWPEYVFLEFDELNSNVTLGWDQWNDRIHSQMGYRGRNALSRKTEVDSDSTKIFYVTRQIYENEFCYNAETKLLGRLMDLYDSQHNSKESNEAFIEIKDLETKRLKYLYSQSPSFDTYFQWKVNSFLKIFSDYGTKPSKAIIFSIYVILIFGLFYLFTPNSWDTLNQNRLIRRIRFITKYFRRDDGMKEVYIEENRDSVMNFEEFKQYMEESRKEVPRYFMFISKPLYYFSLSNYKMTTSALSKLDILKGKWTELPPKRKTGTSILMAIWFLLLILFDLSVKILNALTLSINTFTTLGFGEIPIKGVGRYLSIIQGFIGWFLLTLFSVSLISQLMH